MMNMMIRSAVMAAVAATLCAVAAAPAQAADRGALLHAQRIARLSAGEVNGSLRAAGLPTRPVRSGIAAYRLRYATVGVDGEPRTASALLVLPRGARRSSTVIYEHGTLVRRADAPSAGLDSLASRAAVFYAAAGFATIAPDYLGLGMGRARRPTCTPRPRRARRSTRSGPRGRSRAATEIGWPRGWT